MSRKISYDSDKTMDVLAEVEQQLDIFSTSNRTVHAQFNQIFSELSGEAISSYQNVVNQYMDIAKLAEDHIDFFIQLTEKMDQEVKEADRKSQRMLDDMG
ncbi:hypothetical protein [Gracilibacillus suaedae]|uniref:hypothetical protein n=1 Tax=Gracilibacillus suaedae TaxID=2820273 RepID=UPI001ABEC636|nr:hypothetical protein [Gracilibacillus suaedae]